MRHGILTGILPKNRVPLWARESHTHIPPSGGFNLFTPEQSVSSEGFQRCALIFAHLPHLNNARIFGHVAPHFRHFAYINPRILGEHHPELAFALLLSLLPGESTQTRRIYHIARNEPYSSVNSIISTWRAEHSQLWQRLKQYLLSEELVSGPGYTERTEEREWREIFQKIDMNMIPQIELCYIGLPGCEQFAVNIPPSEGADFAMSLTLQRKDGKQVGMNLNQTDLSELVSEEINTLDSRET